MQDLRIKPVSANDCATSDDASKLDLYLQKQLEEDIARIFDESIYSDLEVVCGKLKVLTHSCILKARTNKFYNKLEAILHLNIGKEIFDEIYSFISDAYTECNIKNQEKEILLFLKSKKITSTLSDCNNSEAIQDVDVFLTPNSTSVSIDKKVIQISCLSPCTDLTKEYYALVHIEGNLLEQGHIEQDTLSDAFHTIIKSKETATDTTLIHNKPTSLSLVFSHSSNTVKHTSNCDIYNQVLNEHATLNNCETKNDQFTKIYVPLKIPENNLNNGTSVDKISDPAFSPDSLITDDPSSSSDYLSAAYAYSPALGTSSCYSQLNIGNISAKMENIKNTVTETSLTETNNISTHETFPLQPSVTSLSVETETIQAIETRVPIPSSTNNIFMSESFNGQKNNNNEGSLEHGDTKNTDPMQKDLSFHLDISISGEDISSLRDLSNKSPCRNFDGEFNRRQGDDTHSPRQDIQFIKETDNVSIPGTSFSNEEINSLPRTPKSIRTSAWVVDMSNHPKTTESEKIAPNLLCKKLDNRTCENVERETSNSDNCRISSINSDSSEKSRRTFFIDWSSLPDPLPKEKPKVNNKNKKSIFSMYIDLGSNSTCKDMPTRLGSCFNNKFPKKNPSKHKLPTFLSNEKKNCISLQPHNIHNTSGLYNSKILPRPKGSCMSINNQTNTENKEKKSCHSRNKGDKSILESHELNSTFEICESICRTNDARFSDVLEETSFELTNNAISEVKKRGENPSILDATFSVCSPKITFEQYEALCNVPNISISEIIAIPDTVSKSAHNIYVSESNRIEKPINRRVNGDKTVASDTVIHEQSNNSNDESPNQYVRLSDLDKPTQNCGVSEKERLESRMTRSIPDNNWLNTPNVQTITPNSNEVISSFHSENAKSLNRLFPHLSNEFSKSMPMSLSERTGSFLQPGAQSSLGGSPEQVSDVSDTIGVPSSMCRSVNENCITEETSQLSHLISNCQSRLGQDLLKMFIEEIATDVVVEVPGKRIKAHKCILSSRCPFFAGILSGGWVESGGNVITLPAVSYNVIHFALCHIYSGTATIPDSVSITELATLVDMLGLEGLKEAIMFSLKAKYCHHFHEPCQVCTVGVLECLPLSSVYGLDDLYRKCLRWITKYFAKVWPTKAFATLPKELLDKCFQEHLINLNIENLFDTVYGSGIIVAALQNNRWGENVTHMCRRLVNAAAKTAAENLLSALEMLSTAPDAPPAVRQALEECLALAIKWAPPEETCRAYAYLSCLVKDIRNKHSAKSDSVTKCNQSSKIPETKLLFTQASIWRFQCEGALVRAAPRVVGTQAFNDLTPELRKRLRELGCISYSPRPGPLNSSLEQQIEVQCSRTLSKRTKLTNAQSLDIQKDRNTFVPYKPSLIAMGSKDRVASNTELRDKNTNKVDVYKVRTTRAQEKRFNFNRSKSSSLQSNLSNKSLTNRSHLFENTKPRYLEPRSVPRKSRQEPAQENSILQVTLSSESSRDSTPVQSKTSRNDRIDKEICEQHGVQATSQDSLATTSRPRTAEPSTDSLTESQASNNYATYTKTQQRHKGSVVCNLTDRQIDLNSDRLSNNKVTSRRGGRSSSLLRDNPKSNLQTSSNHTSTSDANSRQAKSTGARPKIPPERNQNSQKYKQVDRERKKFGFQNATKSSSAKIVSRTTKELLQNKPGKHTSKRDDVNVNVIERSGTFSKDKKTFGG